MNAHSASPRHLRSAALLLAAPLLLLSACNMNAAPSPAVQSPSAQAPTAQPPSTAVPTPPGAPSTALRPLGLMRITFSNIGSSDAAVKAEPVPAGITPQSIASVGGIQLQPVSTGSFVLGTRGAGGMRYLYATFKVRNASAAGVAYAAKRTNLTLMAAGTPGADGMTALSSVKKFDGTPADPAVAPTILPTHGMTFDRASDQAALLSGAEDLQIYSEAEAASLPLPGGITRVFPYGFVVRNPATPSSRTLAANPTAGQFDGVVTIAMKLPLQASATADPFSFSLNVEAVDDSVTRVTESPEEQGAGSSAATRASLLGAGTQVATLCGSSYSGSNDVFVGSATTAGGAGFDRQAHIGGNLALNGPVPSYAVFGNTSASVSASSGLLSNYTAYPPTPGGTAAILSAASSPGTTPGSTLNLNSDGSFGFTPKVGEGSGSTDTLGYSVSDGAGCTSPALTASATVTGRIWYAKNDAPAGGDGRSDTPFQSLASAAAASSAGDTLYVYRGDGTSANQSSGLTLKANQRLIGSGTALTLGAATLRPADASGAPLLGNASGDAVTLATDNTLSGVSISANGGAGVKGSNFSTLTSSTVSVSATGGPALDLSSGAMAGSFDRLSSTGSSTVGVNLGTVSGNLAINNGAVNGAAGTAFNVSGGSVNVTYNGNVTQSNNAALLSVSGKHAGTLTFNGALSATNGSGLQFNDADGTYDVNAAGSSLTLNGGNAGISVSNGSSGTFNLASSAGSASITNPSGAAITVTGSNPVLTYGGSITKTNGSDGVVMSGNTGGTLTFSGASKQISSTGSNVPVNLTNNTGATINFTNGGLALNSATGSGFNVTGGGTVSVSGSGNTVTSSGGTAINVAGSTISGSFDSVSSTNSPTAGVNLTDVKGNLDINAGSISGAAGNAFNVSGGSVSVTDKGTIAQSNNAALLNVSGKHTGTLTFSGALSATNGSGLQFNDADGSYNVNAASSSLTLNGGNAGLSITNGSSGTFNFASSAGSASLTNPSGAAITVTGSNPTLNYGGSITKTNGSDGVVISGNTGGTLTFSGASKQISSTGSSVPVSLTNNTGTTINFTNGGLALSSATGNGLNVTGGGTVSVSGSGNTVTSAGGAAINVVGSSIGSSNLNFQSVSANGGGNGIVLDNTGSLGGLNVIGTGAAGSGGTIQNTSGSDGLQAGNGMYLRNTSATSLKDMNLSNHTNNAVYGLGVRGLILNDVNTSGNNGTSNSGTYQESSVHLEDLGGTVSLTNSTFNGGAYDGVLIQNIVKLGGVATNPTLNLTFSNNKISQMQGSTADVRNTAFQVIAGDGTANITALNNLFTYWWGNAMQVAIQGTATGTAALRNNRALQTSGALAGAGGIEVNGGNLTFDISNNTVAFTNGTAISIDKNPGNTYLNGTISGNQVGYAAASSGPGSSPPQGGSWPSNINSGSAAGTGIFAAHAGVNATTIKVSNNTIRQVNGSQAIWALLGDDAGGGGSGIMNATITGNTIAEEGTAVNSQRTGIVAQAGRVTNDTDTLCADLSSNSITNFNTRIRPNQRFNTKMYLPGYTGASNTTASVNSYLVARNPGTVSVSASSTAGGGGYFNTPGGAACPQPTTLP